MADPVHPVELLPIYDLPEIVPGEDLAEIVMESFRLYRGDVLVLAQKIVSKAEGRLARLSEVEPGAEARRLAHESEKDPRLVQLILDESRRVVRVRPGLIIVEDRRGWVCANAGIDRSNIVQDSGDEVVSLLPLEPDASAGRIRNRILEHAGVDVGVIISDSHGRAWRDGTVGVCIGASGVWTRTDRRGHPDRQGYLLRHTVIGTADEMAAAASLLMGQGDEGVPAVVLRGLSAAGDGAAVDLQRAAELDLFR